MGVRSRSDINDLTHDELGDATAKLGLISGSYPRPCPFLFKERSRCNGFECFCWEVSRSTKRVQKKVDGLLMSVNYSAGYALSAYFTHSASCSSSSDEHQDGSHGIPEFVLSRK
jgi:hypothetical protein